MKTPQTHLQQIFKILTYDFITSIQKMALLKGERLCHPKQTLLSKILDLFVFHQTEEAFEDYAKIFQNSCDEDMKYECFEKDLSVSANNHSDPSGVKYTPSDMESEIQECQKDQFYNSTEKIQREFLSHQRAAESTKYSGNTQEIFRYVDSFSEDIKKEETSSNEKLNVINQIQESGEIKEIMRDDKLKVIMKQEEDEEQEQVDPNDDDSSFTPSNEQEQKYEQNSKIESNRLNKKKLASKAQISKKKYRSYSYDEKILAIGYVI